jgi:hypothetical protein
MSIMNRAMEETSEFAMRTGTDGISGFLAGHPFLNCTTLEETFS